jgi:hypothetical protein
LPHWFHAAATGLTLALELVLIFAAFLPRPVRIALFFLVTPWQIGIILTANYTFLNYLVLVLAFLLLDDRFLSRFFPEKWNPRLPARPSTQGALSTQETLPDFRQKIGRWLTPLGVSVTAVFLIWIFYATAAQMIWMITPAPLPTSPVTMLEPFRIANRYGLFAVMTRGRYEIEFQGSNDGQSWTPYPFRYKPQALDKPPRIYAPYQPRFDWNLWFASLGEWRDNPLVLRTERKLLAGDPDVLALFAGNPFPQVPPRQVRAVLYQYWFTSMAERKSRGLWWRRELLGLYAPAIQLQPDGRIAVTQWPEALPPHE